MRFKCAIKCIQKKQLKDKLNKDMMKGEIETLTDVTHPNIMRVYQLLHDKESYYFIAELAPYGDIDELYKRKIK